jgi:signal transduction histidine kinase
MKFDITKPERAASPRRIFTFLLFYRWLSLVVPLVAWLLQPERPLLLALLMAAAVNGLISFFSAQLNQALRRYPWLLLADFVLMAALISLTGSWETPFYFYSLNPLLIAAFFFGVRGAVTAVSAFLPLYTAALLLTISQAEVAHDWLLVVTAVVGYYLISGTFGFAAGLVSHLRQTQDDLLFSHRKLNTLHALTVSLQSASDVEAVQEKVLAAVTTELGFKKAVIGLVEPGKFVISGWLGRVRDGLISENGRPNHSIQIELKAENGPAAQSLLDRQPMRVVDDWLNEQFRLKDAAIFPLYLREHSIGVLLVETEGVDEDMMQSNGRFAALSAVAGQAAVAIGTTILCINRAQEIAVQEERMRIARELHDTVSQSLFGIVYTLDGSLKLLPEQPEEAIPELERVLKTAEQVRAGIRHSILDIWPAELTSERFTADLEKYVQESCQVGDLQLSFDVRGEFSQLSPQVRRSLYRISQESLTNIARHAAASEARVCVDIAQGRARLVVRDNGRGFVPSEAVDFDKEYGREHFGLRGIQERAKSLNGECHIFSQPGEGTSIIVDIPVN